MMTTDHTANAEQLQKDLRQFTGTGQYRHPAFPALTYTDGVRHLARQARAYWLIDAIFAAQAEPDVKKERLQVWTLAVEGDNTAVLDCTDWPGHLVYKEEIASTDFPLGIQHLCLTEGVLMLLSEF